MRRFFLLPLLLFSLSACETTEEAVDDTGEGVEDAADAVVTVGRGAADTAADAAEAGVDLASNAASTVVDAAGNAWDAVTDLFEDDPDADAAALVRPTMAGDVQGTVRFYEMGDQLRVAVSLRGLDPNQAHGFHIHQTPACGPADTDGDGQMEAAAAAGGHWDPLNTNDHGGPTEELMQKHLGDLGNIQANAEGMVETTFMVDNFPTGEYDVAGHAMMVHAQRDNLEEDPSGSAGDRVGCGVIEARMM